MGVGCNSRGRKISSGPGEGALFRGSGEGKLIFHQGREQRGQNASFGAKFS